MGDVRWLTLLIIFFLIDDSSTEIGPVQSYSGYKLLRLHTNDIEWIQQLEEDLSSHNANSQPLRPQIDIWAEPNRLRSYADIMVAPEFLDKFLFLLQRRRIEQVDIVKHDLQSDINKRNDELNFYANDLRVKREVKSSYSIEDFNIVEHLRNLTWQYPELVEIINFTKTFEGRDLIGVKIGRAKDFKPSIFIDAGIHAREWIAPAVALYVIHNLVTRYGKDDDVTRMVNKFDWYVVPSANPDGYEYSMTVDRYWRKTRSKNETVSKWCYGVDANRNWGYRWGEVGVSRNPCSSIYAGSSAFSEVEIAGIRDYITWKIPDLKIYVSLHSYGQVILSPWGYTTKKPDSYNDQNTLARIAVEAIKNKTGANYKFGSISELMYPASGTSIDYMLSKKIPYTYGIELRPEDAETSPGFDIPISDIEPTGEEMLSAFLTIAKYVANAKKI